MTWDDYVGFDYTQTNSESTESKDQQPVVNNTTGAFTLQPKPGEDNLPEHSLVILSMLNSVDPDIIGFRVRPMVDDKDTWACDTVYANGEYGKVWGEGTTVLGMRGGSKYNVLNPQKVLDQIEEEEAHLPREV